jgi:nitrogen-specific signal transduction histidine kinase/CheY-like chemotaxis protein
MHETTCEKENTHHHRGMDLSLKQSRTMEALVQFASGIVHDFNNLIQIINGFTELELLSLDEGDESYHNLMQIKTACDRGRDLTSQLRLFTRQDSSERKPVNINKVVEETRHLTRSVFPEQIDVRLRLNRDLKIIAADTSQMSRMFMNLCCNARDAITSGIDTEEEGVKPDFYGTIHIETDNVVLNSSRVFRHFDAVPGEYVLIRVADDGVGMDETVIEHLFEPFFTTKDNQSGIGLGLSVIYGIVRNHGGFIDVKSTPGRGSIFDVFLPVCTDECQTQEERASSPSLVSGSGMILLVENEDQVRELAAGTLRSCGYSLLVAKNGRQAVKLYRTHAAAVNLIVLDTGSTCMGTAECFQELKQIDSLVKVLVVTGCSSASTTCSFLKDGAAGVIEKPFDLERFTSMVQKLVSS